MYATARQYATILLVLIVVAAGFAVAPSAAAPKGQTNTFTLSATAASASSVQLSWDNVPGQTEYVVYRTSGTGSELAVVVSTRSRSHLDTGLSPASSYRYQVIASSKGREVARSTVATVTTQQQTSTTTAPTSTTSTTVAPTSTTVPPASTTTSCTGVSVAAGADLQAAINANPVGTRFCLDNGVYAVPTPLKPKDGQQFVARNRRGAVLTGNGTGTMAFDGHTVPNVVIDGLVVERFATPFQGGLGAVRIGPRGSVLNSEIRFNSYNAIYHSDYVRIAGNFIHDNYSGLSGYKSVGAVIEGNEVAFNNVTNTRSDGGGSKWTGTRDLVIRNNHFHDNTGTGIWLDGDNINVLIENNRSDNNRGAGGKGIQYEISCAGVVRNNTLTGNEMSGIELVASQNVEVYGNTLQGNANGIRVWHQDRGAGGNCAWTLKNVVIHHNTVHMDRGATGLWKWNVSDGDAIFSPTDGRVAFRDNTYYLKGTAEYHQWANETRTVQEWKSFGQDVTGVAQTV